jgi:ATP-dependent helicase/nuclease subunit A
MDNSPRKWTVQQKAGIETVGGSLLLSAAAGSGKTAVLAERCAHLVCDANPPCNVDQLLVVTFTDSAAAEMKARIQQSLRMRIAQRPGDHRLARQAALVEHAHVSTVHGFCTRLLRRRFDLAGLDPNFRILSEDEAALLRSEVSGDLLNRRHEDENADDFRRLIDCYAAGDDERLMERVISAYQLLQSLVDPVGWRKQKLADLDEAAKLKLNDSVLGREFIQHIDSRLMQFARQCKESADSIASMDRGLAPYADRLGEFKSMAEHWLSVLRNDGLDMLVSEFRDFCLDIPQAPKVAGNTPGKEIGKKLLDAVKDEITERDLAELLMFDSARWQQTVKDILPHARAFLSLVDDFDQEYAAAKKQLRALDFADLERGALNILKAGEGSHLQPSAVAKSLHEQYRHVLVDEYQDINEIQDAILTLVSRECVAGADSQRANLFCVGDVKQSIFRFRLADPNRFLDRQDRFEKSSGKSSGQLIRLQENFRSRRALLEAINAVFDRLMTRESSQIDYQQSHRLRAGKEFPPSGNLAAFAGAPIELHLLPRKFEKASEDDADMERAEYEALCVARRIEEMMGKHGGPRMHVVKDDKLQPIEYGDMVILLRAMQFKADAFADVLRAHNIPVHSDGGTGFFDATEVRDILSLLRILDNQLQDIPLAAVLRGPLAGIPQPDDALATIRLAYRDESEDVPFHQAVRRYAIEKDDELAAHLRDFLARVADWRDQANKRPIAETLWRIYEQTGFLAYCSGLEDGEQRVANLLEFHERAAQFSGFLRQGLHRFLEFVEALRQERELSRPTLAGDASNVVRIMSIHRAKGLEFPVVFIPDLGKRHNLRDAEGSILVDRVAGLGMDVIDERKLIRYPSISSILVKDSLLNQTLAEELRLLYVAMTRAKEQLILVGTASEEESDRWAIQWRKHIGPMPADAILTASNALQWLGPVAAMTQASNAIQIIPHDETEIRAWPNPRMNRPAFTPLQQRLAHLEKRPGPREQNELADQITARFQRIYAYANETRQSATVSVTTLAKSDHESTYAAATTPARKLDLPKFFSQSTAAKPTDIGTATHLVLQHWDFASSKTDAMEIQRQINSQIDRKFIAPASAKLVDQRAIEWFVNTDLAQQLREHHGELLREIPFALATPLSGHSDSADPLDLPMIRGRIDLLLPTAGGYILVDYKTDQVTADTIAARAQTYREQMRFYRQAVEQIAGAKLSGIHLVFLTPRIIESL